MKQEISGDITAKLLSFVRNYAILNNNAEAALLGCLQRDSLRLANALPCSGRAFLFTEY